MKIEESMEKSDYIYCEDCEEFIDVWKYDNSLEVAGHANCKTRTVTDEELMICIKNCKDFGCFRLPE